MKKIIFIAFVSVAFLSCNNNPKNIVDNKISLQPDTINTVKLTDTLVIYESTCRGCAYEESTYFGISDSMNIIKLANIISADNNPANMDGGSISKKLILIPEKTGTTIIKLYKFWGPAKTAEDSARFTSYKIEVTQ